MTKLFTKECNERDTYAIVDDKGNTVETFRLKAAAIESLVRLKRSFYCGLKIVRLK